MSCHGCKTDLLIVDKTWCCESCKSRHDRKCSHKEHHKCSEKRKWSSCSLKKCHKKNRCFDIIIINQGQRFPVCPPVNGSSPVACGCTALISTLTTLVSTPVPTEIQIATAVAQASAYVACRTPSGLGGLDVIALQTWLTYQATLAPGVFDATARALATTALGAVQGACTQVCPPVGPPCCCPGGAVFPGTAQAFVASPRFGFASGGSGCGCGGGRQFW